MKLKLFDEEVIRQEKVLLITTSFSLDLTTLSSEFPEFDKYLNVLNIHSDSQKKLYTHLIQGFVS